MLVHHVDVCFIRVLLVQLVVARQLCCKESVFWNCFHRISRGAPVVPDYVSKPLMTPYRILTHDLMIVRCIDRKTTIQLQEMVSKWNRDSNPALPTCVCWLWPLVFQLYFAKHQLTLSSIEQMLRRHLHVDRYETKGTKNSSLQWKIAARANFGNWLSAKFSSYRDFFPTFLSSWRT